MTSDSPYNRSGSQDDSSDQPVPWLSDIQNAGEWSAQDDPVDDDTPKRSIWRSILSCCLIAMAGSWAAFLWRASGDVLPSAGKTKASEIVLLNDVAGAQQAISALVKTNQQLLQAQGAEMTQQSGAIAQLIRRLDALEASTRNAQAFEAHELQKSAPKKPSMKKFAPVPRSLARPATAPVQIAPHETQ